jgi:hypothetical protein
VSGVREGAGTFAPGPLPLPPADLARCKLPIHLVPPGTVLHRIHRAALDPLFFGPAPGNAPAGRWDAPAGEFGVCYLAEAPYVAFAETFLRVPGIGVVGEDDLSTRGIARFHVVRPLRLVGFHGAGLARIGATAAVCSGPHDVSRAWSLSIHRHPSAVDGIRYRARHDDDGFAVALFDRGAASIERIDSTGLMEDGFRVELGGVLERYELALG